MYQKRGTSVIKNQAKPSINSGSQLVAFQNSSSATLNALLKSCQEYTKATGKPINILIGSNPDEIIPTLVISENKEKLENSLKPTGSEEREITTKEEDRKNERKAFFWERIIDAFIESISKHFK